MGIFYFYITYNSYSFVCVKYNSKDDSGITPKKIMYYIVGEKGKKPYLYITLAFQSISAHTNLSSEQPRNILSLR